MHFVDYVGDVFQDIDATTDYHSFRKKWGNDPRFEVLDRKDRESLLNERYFISLSVRNVFVDLMIAIAIFRGLYYYGFLRSQLPNVWLGDSSIVEGLP